jgi:ribosomal protein S18 acetylase RimI-like enzyme
VISFRHATTADAEAVLELWSRAAEDSGRPSDDADALLVAIDRDAQALELALDGEAIVGTLLSGFDGWRCALYRLAVDPAYRGRGIAGTLLEHAERRFSGFGATRSLAMVLDANELGAGFWRSHGYEPQSEWSRWAKPL